MLTGIAETMLGNPLDDWIYQLDLSSRRVTLQAYIGSDKEVVVYEYYYAPNGMLVKTRLSGNHLRPQEINDPEKIYMFKNSRCKKIVIGDKVDVSQCVIMRDMFRNCINLEEIDFGTGFDTCRVADMSGMFRGCSKLKKLDLRGFDTSNVLDMRAMFFGCESLTDLWVTNFDTRLVRDFMLMFKGCKSLKNLNLTSFVINNAGMMDNMFRECESLEKVYFRLSNCGNNSAMIDAINVIANNLLDYGKTRVLNFV